MSVLIKCLHCNKEFKTYPSQIKRGGGKYCSKICHGFSKVGIKFSLKRKENIKQSLIGRKLSKKHRKKLREVWKGKSKPWLLGKKHSKEHREKLDGENHWNWKGGISPINERIRKTLEYKLWRISVFERDNYTCIWCGQIGGTLNADHIKPFSLFPELRFAIDNGRTLCVFCHRKTDTYGWKMYHLTLILIRDII